MKQQLLQLWRDEDGATAIEYALIAGLIAAAIMVTVGLLGGRINTLFTSILESLGGAVEG